MRHDLIDEFAIRGVVRRWQRGIKSRELEELPRRSCHDETVVSVVWLNLLRVMRGLARRVIEHVFPNQIVAIGKRVASENEWTLADAAHVSRHTASERHQR